MNNNCSKGCFLQELDDCSAIVVGDPAIEVREERERLQQMQEEWEEKFRQAEIEASLERAKLSRERQEVASKMADLEEQLAHAKRDSRHSASDDDGTSRRWLAKLGLADSNA